MKTIKTGLVYIWNNKHHVYVKRKILKEDRIVVELCKVRPDGSLCLPTIRKLRLKEFAETTGIRVEIKIHLPKVDENKIKYEELVEEVHTALQKVKRGKLSKKEAKKLLAINCLTAITYYNKEADRPYNLRDFAKSLELKRYTKVYSWITSTMIERVRQDKQNTKELSDRSLKMIFVNYKKYFHSLVGFNKDLDTIVKTNLKDVIAEIKHRGI